MKGATDEKTGWQEVTALLEAIRAELEASRKERDPLRLVLEAFFAPQDASSPSEDEEASGGKEASEAGQHPLAQRGSRPPTALLIGDQSRRREEEQ